MIATASRKTKILNFPVFDTEFSKFGDFSKNAEETSNLSSSSSLMTSSSLLRPQKLTKTQNLLDDLEDDEIFLKRAEVLLKQLKSTTPKAKNPRKSAFLSSKSSMLPKIENNHVQEAEFSQSAINSQFQQDCEISQIEPEKIEKVRVFHETQQGLFCGKHAINNLFQQPIISVKKMDKIADEIFQEEQSLFQITDETSKNKKKSKPKFSVKIKNRHKTKKFLMGSLGNYSFEVISKTIEENGCVLEALKLNQTPKKLILELNDERVVGLLVNRQNYIYRLPKERIKQIQQMNKKLAKKQTKKSIFDSIFECFGISNDSHEEIPQNYKNPDSPLLENNFLKENDQTNEKKEPEGERIALGGHWFSVGKVKLQDSKSEILNLKNLKNLEKIDKISENSEILSTESPLLSNSASRSPFIWVNHDSKLRIPKPFYNTFHLVVFLKNEILFAPPSRTTIFWKVMKKEDSTTISSNYSSM